MNGFVGALLAFAVVALVATLRDLWLTGRRKYTASDSGRR
jgi:uncharacterized membrane protein YedE/YeeE